VSARRSSILILAAAGTLLVVGALVGTSAAGGALPTTVTVTIRYSGFEPTDIVVPRGVPVTFVIVNEDPIAHEWIVGDADVHERHRTGTEPAHDHRPTEISVPPLATRQTTIMFADPGTRLMICHLPGHEAHGMVATLRVV
jgi:uncharacterized cupredoxin-like copper-binding protein